MHKESFVEKVHGQMTVYNIVWNTVCDKYIREISALEKYERYRLLSSEYLTVNQLAVEMYVGLIKRGFIVEESLTDES